MEEAFIPPQAQAKHQQQPPPFTKERHIQYWLRCLKTFLPTEYTPNDSIRTTLAFFTLAALDLLAALPSRTTATERADYIAWLYRCQLPRGAFRSSPATDLGARAAPSNARWDGANLSATYFALAALAILGDDLRRVNRTEILQWLVGLQRADGSFEDSAGGAGGDARVVGVEDIRFCYWAAGVRWILRGRVRGGEAVGAVPDIDVDAVVRYINASETYDHGFAQAPYLEAHAGLTYCAISALSFLDRLPKADNNSTHPSHLTGISSPPLTIRWLLNRQTPISPNSQIYGFNGRPNKPPDTCYSFWVCGSLSILAPASQLSTLLPTAGATDFLLGEAQHRIGGFGKHPGDPPDVLHSYLGLAAASLLSHAQGAGEALDLEPASAVMCISVRARRWIEALPWWSGELEK
ncbi:MAG: hypothetical protein M1829_003047 [Trizodia sp. TS-e1964]|nr:MAG: hypothetical protein M1829_003047 [Trizodia sp. TS-e1964]